MKKRSLVSILGLLVVLTASLPAYAVGNEGELAQKVIQKLKQKVQAKKQEFEWAENAAVSGAGPQQIYGNELDKYFPDVLQQMILQNLASSAERCAASEKYAFHPVVRKAVRAGIDQHQLEIVKKYLPQFIELPQVTAQEARDLGQVLTARGESTSIQAPANAAADAVVIPKFRIADVKNSVGLYKAVMGSYPDLTKCYNFQYGRNFSPQEAEEQYRHWDKNSDLPLVCTTSAEDIAFAAKLSEITGKRFRIVSNAENEYSIRARELDADGKALGNITTTKYHFGNSDDEVKNHAFISTNPLTQNRAHGVHEIPRGADPAHYKNGFGLFHPIGNVWARSAQGVVRGGAFRDSEWGAELSFSIGAHEFYRYFGSGSRLAEDL